MTIEADPTSPWPIFTTAKSCLLLIGGTVVGTQT